MKKIIFIVLLLIAHNIDATALNENRSPKILHLSFHDGCIKDFEVVAQEFGLNLTSWYILDSYQAHQKFDPQAPNRFDPNCPSRNWGDVYNITHDRAERVWLSNYDYFQTFDAIITSDTAPLSRIFLQNNWKKPLIIWICNRFDYYDGANPQGFPDHEYYQLFRSALHKENVEVVGYVAYEHYYAAKKNVNTGNIVIKPVGSAELEYRNSHVSYIPENIEKSSTFFIPLRLDPPQVNNLIKKCSGVGIRVYCGKYNGPADLIDFKGIIHIPYQWSNLALFEGIQLGIPYFVPSIKFIRQLRNSSEHHFYRYIGDDPLELSEWYCPEHKEIITYFDSWQDLKNKIDTIDFVALREKIKSFGLQHRDLVLSHWNKIFKKLKLI